MLKVFNGTGGWDFTLRFQEEPGFGVQPITEGITLSLTPPVVEVPGASLKPGDVNGDGSFNISDPVAHLNALFGGGDWQEHTLWTLGWCVAFLVVFMPLAIRAYNRRA